MNSVVHYKDDNQNTQTDRNNESKEVNSPPQTYDGVTESLTRLTANSCKKLLYGLIIFHWPYFRTPLCRYKKTKIVKLAWRFPNLCNVTTQGNNAVKLTNCVETKIKALKAAGHKPLDFVNGTVKCAKLIFFKTS